MGSSRDRVSRCYANNASNGSFETAIVDFSHRKFTASAYSPFATSRKERTRSERYRSIIFGYVRITEDELDALPTKLSQLIRTLFVPTDGEMYFPNHGMNVIRLNGYLNRERGDDFEAGRVGQRAGGRP